jgi:hypothetical protein
VISRCDSSARRRSLRITRPVASQGSNSLLGARFVPPSPTPKGRWRCLSSSSESGRDSSREPFHLQPIENDRLPATRSAFFVPRKGPTATCPPMEFLSPSTYSNKRSDLHRAFLTRLCSASRLSQPLDALLRTRPFGPFSCRIRPWGSCSQRFPPPGSRHGFFFTAPAPVRCRRLADPPPAPYRSTVPASHRPAERVGQGFVHPGGPFTAETVLPATRRSVLSQRLSPLRGFLPSSLDATFATSTLMGFPVMLDLSITTAALQSVKEHEGRLTSFESCLPPWGFLS